MKEFSLYGGEVTGVFDPEARYRYTITDPVNGLKDKKVRGVTTVIGDILDKPGLRLWARDEMAKALFGMTLDKDYNPIYNMDDAMITPGIAYKEGHLQEMLSMSFNAYTIKTDRGKDIGTMTHDMIAKFLAKEIDSIDESIVKASYPEADDEHVKCTVKAVRGFMVWWSSIINKEVLGTEVVIYSRRFQFSGTYDLKVKINNKVYMLDIKTTNRSASAPLGIYPEYFMQLGGYMQADMEGSGQKFDDCGIINVGKDGNVNIITASDIGMDVEECIGSFIYAIQIHNWLERVKKLTNDPGFISSLSEPNSKVEEFIKEEVNNKLKEEYEKTK